MHIEERLKYAIYLVAYKSLDDPQFPKYMKLKTKKDKRVLRNNNEQTGPLIDHIGETGTFAQDAKMIYNVLPTDIRESEKFNKFRNNTKRYFYDMPLARCKLLGFYNKMYLLKKNILQLHVHVTQRGIPYMCVCIYIYRSIYLSIYRSIYLSVYLSMYMYIQLLTTRHKLVWKLTVLDQSCVRLAS